MAITVKKPGGTATALTGTTLRVRARKPQNSGLSAGFSNVVLEQVPGATNQARVTFDFAGKTDGIIYARFKSNYAGEGKPPAMTYGIEVATDRLDGKYQINSAANLVPGTTYTCALYWSDGVDSLPTGTAVATSNALTIVSPTESVATSISPNRILVPLGTTAGTVVAQLAADVPGGSFAEGSPNSSLFIIAANGQVTLAQDAVLAGEWPLIARHTTSAGTYETTVDGTVYQISGGGGSSDTHPDFTADYTATTWAQVTAKLNEWQANPSGTAPAGKTAMEDRVIRLTGSHVQSVTLQNYTFGTATHPFVRVVGSGSFTESGATAKTKGKITIANCSGLSIWLMEIEATGDQNCLLNNTTDCGFGKLWIKGLSATGPTAIPFRTQGIYLIGTNTRPLLTDIALEGWVIGMQINGNTTDYQLRWSTWDWLSHDYHRCDYGVQTRPHIHHNLLAARYINEIGTDAHQDFAQFRSNSTDGTNVQYLMWEYNMMVQRQAYLGGKTSNQGVFFGGGSNPSRNTTMRQNFGFLHNGMAKFTATGTSGGSLVVYNAQVVPTGFNPNVSGLGGNADYNYTTTNRDAEDKGAGPNGKSVNGGDSVVASIYADDLNGTPSLTADWDEFRPKVGGVLHWNHSNPIGPWDLWREYLVDNLTHEERGWPVAVLARRTMNPNGTALPLSTYTGNFNGDGDNV